MVSQVVMGMVMGGSGVPGERTPEIPIGRGNYTRLVNTPHLSLPDRISPVSAADIEIESGAE